MKNKAYVADENEINQTENQKVPYSFSTPIKVTPQNINGNTIFESLSLIQQAFYLI